MMKQICVFLADGFEEIEGLTVVDLLRRAGVQVTTVSIMNRLTIHGAHGIDVQADELFENIQYDTMDMIVLPGGMPGTRHLQEHAGVSEILKKASQAGRYIAAICAAPSVLGSAGLLQGKKATCYPGFEESLSGAEYVKSPVVDDGTVITSRGLGTAIPFSLKLIEVLINAEKAREIATTIIYE